MIQLLCLLRGLFCLLPSLNPCQGKPGAYFDCVMSLGGTKVEQGCLHRPLQKPKDTRVKKTKLARMNQ